MKQIRKMNKKTIKYPTYKILKEPHMESEVSSVNATKKKVIKHRKIVWEPKKLNEIRIL